MRRRSEISRRWSKHWTHLGAALLAVAAATWTTASPARAQGPRRVDHRIAGEPGITLFVREVRDDEARQMSLPPVLLLHGARVPSVASFDLPVPGYSLAADLASAGFAVYLLDVRGYGGSTRPPEMDGPPEAHPPLVRSYKAVRDIHAAVTWIMEREGVASVALLGWATGGHWAGHYASLYPENVSHLVLYNTLYGGSDRHDQIGPGSSLEDPEIPGRFNRAYGAYRLSTAESLFGAWDASIPFEDKAQWRDPRVAEAYAEAALASDPTSHTREPASFRAPSGAMEDSYYLASGRRLWDASSITAATLVIRSGSDFWSRPEDAEVLSSHLTSAARVRTVTIPGATHFVHLDRPERGRAQFVEEVVRFLSGG
ncbi:MAG: alpha/beta fold hydrolase [Gemmatimonadota bacterium]